MGQIEVPRKMVYFAIFSFCISIFANFVGIATELGIRKSGNASPALPLKPRPVALKYMGAESDPIHSADEWDSLYPPGDGFVRLGGSYYLVSMYHQMHCVNSFRRSIEEYRAGTNTTTLRMMHLTHCLSYLRQAILCNADISLEITSLRHTVDGEVVHAAYGAGVTHECRDWKEVHDWVERNHMTWEDDDDFEVLR